MWWMVIASLLLVIWLFTQGVTGWAWPVSGFIVVAAVLLAKVKGGRAK